MDLTNIIISVSLTLLEKAWQKHKASRWKNRRIFYINSSINKRFEQREVSMQCRDFDDYKVLEINSRSLDRRRKIKRHFLKMKKGLYQIYRNLGNNADVMYAGYPSVPFAIYDGFSLGDNRSYTFWETQKDREKTYQISFKKKRIGKRSRFEIAGKTDEVNLLIESSYGINDDSIKCRNLPTFRFTTRCEDKITAEYLNSVYYWVLDLLDSCSEAGVKTVHLYSSSRPCVSFIVGTAIQRRHPRVIAYEYKQGKYTWGIPIQEESITEGE